MVKCAVINCKAGEFKSGEVSFYRFPTNPIARKKWINAIYRGDWTPTNNDSVCSLHFPRDAFLAVGGKNYLREHALPSIIDIDQIIGEEDSLSNLTESLDSSCSSPTLNQTSVNTKETSGVKNNSSQNTTRQPVPKKSKLPIKYSTDHQLDDDEIFDDENDDTLTFHKKIHPSSTPFKTAEKPKQPKVGEKKAPTASKNLKRPASESAEDKSKRKKLPTLEHTKSNSSEKESGNEDEKNLKKIVIQHVTLVNGQTARIVLRPKAYVIKPDGTFFETVVKPELLYSDKNDVHLLDDKCSRISESPNSIAKIHTSEEEFSVKGKYAQSSIVSSSGQTAGYTSMTNEASKNPGSTSKICINSLNLPKSIQLKPVSSVKSNDSSSTENKFKKFENKNQKQISMDPEAFNKLLETDVENIKLKRELEKVKQRYEKQKADIKFLKHRANQANKKLGLYKVPKDFFDDDIEDDFSDT